MRGLRFPDELRIPFATSCLEAAGARARVVESDGLLRITIDGATSEVRVVPARTFPAATAVTCWPFGAERRYADGPPHAGLIERVFVAPSHPIVVLEWACAESIDLRLQLRVHTDARASLLSEDDTIGIESTHAPEVRVARIAAGSTARLIVTAPDEERADVDALAAAAVARARRRTAGRPALIMPLEADEIGADRFAELEHAIHLSRAGAPSAEASKTLAALAQLGLNERQPARQRLSEENDAARRAALAGAWAAWTGDAEALEPVRSPLVSWLRPAREPNARQGEDAAGAWTRAARALAPALAELLGDAPSSGSGRAADPPEPADSLLRLAAQSSSADELARASARVLGLLHDTLGIVPDAPRGRLRLAPRIEDSSIRLTGLVVGDASFTMEAGLVDSGRAFVRIEQSAGSAPFTLILEPWVRARGYRSAQIDGVRAELAASREGAGWRPRVQLVADHPREISMEFE